jgi:amidase
MTIPLPTEDQIIRAAETCGLSLSAEDVRSYRELMRPMVDGYNIVDRLPNPYPEVAYKRTPGRAPTREEDPHNAWYVKTEIEGAAAGSLKGKRVAIKDNIMVAGVPMMNGSSLLEGYVPEIDATVVTRILDAGGTIVGKTHCENFCISGGSHTGAKGPVHNPYRMGYSAGGSSSGSGVVVATGQADMALGGDQGGSIRMPSAWCGLYGMKPTHGLVPYTGIMPIEIMIDHVGPITASVPDNALLLEVVAGADGYDPRQYGPRVHNYRQEMQGGVSGMRIALVKEGFERPESEQAVDDKVRNAARRFQSLGATVEEISIPMHLVAPNIWTPIAVGGITETMMFGDGYGLSRRDLYVESLSSKLHGWQLRSDELSESTKVITVLGVYIRQQFGPRFYGKAMNLTRMLIAAYDSVLADFDLLMMPTLPMAPTPLPEEDCPRDLYLKRAFEMTNNTSPFDISHHPAMNVPCGLVDGLPVGLMLVGRHFDEARIYRVALAFEQAGDWKGM